MEIKLRCHDKVIELINKGVDIPNPLSLDLGDEIKTENISSNGVKIYPGCRLYGEKTVISANSKIGYEAPVTINNCQIGPNVELKGGFFSESVFLEKASMGSGAQVREGCILEEEANGAHCVGIKQTILFPFVTLGSLINFCDCLMAGGTSRKDHSEVGSSYIHFNFTPDGDKTTASLIGDVPRGVLLNQPAIFLGGQGGIVGPMRMGFGNVVAANSVLRNDYIDDNKLIIGKSYQGKTIDYRPKAYPNLRRIIQNNIIYLANLIDLEAWYIHVRRPFFDLQELGRLVFEGAVEKLAMAKKERIKRLEVLAGKVKTTDFDEQNAQTKGRNEFHSRFSEIAVLFSGGIMNNSINRSGEEFLSAFNKSVNRKGSDYLSAIQGLPREVSEKGTLWLQGVIDDYCKKTGKIIPSFGLFAG
jgi:UDP-N-acetylglucosamine/UDP-N-acetylgalactosamine diphosphorylase